MFSVTALLLLTAGAHASVLTLQSPRFSITSANGTPLRSEPISMGIKLSPVTLAATDTLKLTFQITEKDSEEGVQPHQTFLHFYDQMSGEEGIQPVRVTSGGKAKFELNMARPHSSLPPTSSSPLKVTLLLGSFVHDPAKFDLFDLHLPASHPAPEHPDEPSFHLLPAIEHTFRPEQKLPPRIISAFFTSLVFSPWAVLIGLWLHIRPSVPRLFSPSIVPFTALIGAFEVLLVWYWVDLKLGQVLLYGSILSVFAIFAGRQALASIGRRRVGGRKKV
jgi:oligosaccharyltransferase complex subunit delta (ribophorin II)